MSAKPNINVLLFSLSLFSLAEITATAGTDCGDAEIWVALHHPRVMSEADRFIEACDRLSFLKDEVEAESSSCPVEPIRNALAICNKIPEVNSQRRHPL